MAEEEEEEEVEVEVVAPAGWTDHLVMKQGTRDGRDYMQIAVVTVVADFTV